MQTLLQDIRYALRQLRRSPGFTIVAVLTLALGIGANTAIYSIIHGALRLPYPHSDRMVAIQNVYPQGAYFSASYPDVQLWREQSKTLLPIVAMSPRNMTWVGPARPELLNVNMISDGYLGMYGLRAIAGRSFLPSEHVKGAARVCILSEEFWHKEFNGDLSVVGKSLDLDGKSCTVVGVVSPQVNNIRPAQVWMPLEPAPPEIRPGWNYLFTTAMLRPGVTQAQALGELRNLQAAFNRQYPDHKHGIDIQPLSKAVFGDLRSLLFMLQAAVGFILLIACVNLANMLLARAANRSREFGVRRALGASGVRMVRQTLTESLLLSFAGAAAGIAVAQALVHVPIAAWPRNFVPPASVHMDAAVLYFAILLAIGTGVLFGIIPALRILREDGKGALEQGRTVTESREQNRTRAILVIAEIAFSMLLVAGALNMAFYFVRVLHTSSGMNPDKTLAMTISLSPAQYSQPADRSRFFDTLLEKLSVLPGVTHTGAIQDVPFRKPDSNGDFTYGNQPDSASVHNPFADFHYITPGYFAAVGTPLIAGRDFTNADGPAGQKVIIINQSAARRLWPGQSAIGKSIHCCIEHGDFVVVGVASDVRFGGPAAHDNFTFYMSQDQIPQPRLTFLLRTNGDPLLLAKAAEQAVASVDRNQPVSDVTTLDAVAQDSVAPQRTSTLIVSIIGLLALLLAGIGVYGVMAYSVSRRAREFGIRMALGSDRSGIARLLLAGTLRLTVIGMMIGVALAFTMQAWIDSILGAEGTNPLALAAAAFILCCIAGLATLVPARHAMYVEPMQALRIE